MTSTPRSRWPGSTENMAGHRVCQHAIVEDCRLLNEWYWRVGVSTTELIQRYSETCFRRASACYWRALHHPLDVGLSNPLCSMLAFDQPTTTGILRTTMSPLLATSQVGTLSARGRLRIVLAAHVRMAG